MFRRNWLKLVGIVLGAGLFSAAALPVMAQADVAALETAIHGKPVALRTYSADQVARYTWTDGKLLPAYVEMHGLRVFFPDTVRQKGTKITIEGQTSTLVRNGPKLAPMGKTPMRLEIDIDGAKAETVVPLLQAGLFFASIQDALKGLPAPLMAILPFPADGVYHASPDSFILQDGKWVKVAGSDTKLKPLVFAKKPADAGLDQKGVDAGVSGSITLVYLVSTTGRVDEVWLAKPLGGGLDELAAKAGRDNEFNPAMYDGSAVGSVLVQTLGVNVGAAGK